MIRCILAFALLLAACHGSGQSAQMVAKQEGPTTAGKPVPAGPAASPIKGQTITVSKKHIGPQEFPQFYCTGGSFTSMGSSDSDILGWAVACTDGTYRLMVANLSDSPTTVTIKMPNAVAANGPTAQFPSSLKRANIGNRKIGTWQQSGKDTISATFAPTSITILSGL